MRSATLPSILALGLATLSLADDATTTTVAYFYPSISDSSSIDFTIPYYSATAASIVSVNALETTLAINCLSNAPTSICSIKDPQTMIQGESTWSWNGAYTNLEEDLAITVSLDYGCSFTSYSLDASCTYSVSMEGSSGAESYSTSLETDLSFATGSSAGLLVTAGVDKLSQPEATETPGGAAAKVEVAGPFGAFVTAAPVVAAGVVAWF